MLGLLLFMSISTGSDGVSNYEYIIVDGVTLYIQSKANKVFFRLDPSSKWHPIAKDDDFELIKAAQIFIQEREATC